MTKAVEESLDVLNRLGEPLPSDPQKYHIFIDFVRTKQLLRGKTNEMILRMPLMTEPDKIATSQILNLMIPSTFRTRPLLFALVVLRLVRLSMMHGVCAVSAVGFGYYGSILCAFSNDIDDGCRYGQLALSLLDKFKTKEWTPRVYLGVYGHIGSYKLPLQEMYPHLDRAQQIAFETGDTEVKNQSVLVSCVLQWDHLLTNSAAS
jgi:predicted ATPase